jgi:hypothetical protein
MKVGGITNLWIPNLPQDVVQDIEIGLQVHYLTICWITIKVHVLVLLHLNILILYELSSMTVSTIQTKEVRESNKVHLVVLTLHGLVDDVNSTNLVLLMMIGSIKLHDDIVVPMPPKLHQVNEPNGAQILNHLLQLRLLKLTMCISINALRLHNLVASSS